MYILYLYIQLRESLESKKKVKKKSRHFTPESAPHNKLEIELFYFFKKKKISPLARHFLGTSWNFSFLFYLFFFFFKEKIFFFKSQKYSNFSELLKSSVLNKHLTPTKEEEVVDKEKPSRCAKIIVRASWPSTHRDAPGRES